METQVQWLLGANYTELAPEQQPLECVQEPGDVVYLPDGWLHATVWARRKDVLAIRPAMMRQRQHGQQ